MTAEQSVSVTERTYERLREAILRGEYRPGDRLTSVRLSDDLGVSRTPVRAALARLQTEGLVDFVDGRSARIPPLTVEAVEEAYEIAEALESMLVERLAEIATDDHLEEVHQALVQMEAAADSGDQVAWADADTRFHALIHAHAGRELATSMLNRVDNVISRVRFLSLNLHPEGAALSAAEHRAVVEAMRARDAGLARERHAAHLRRVRTENVDFLRRSLPMLGTLPTD